MCDIERAISSISRVTTNTLIQPFIVGKEYSITMFNSQIFPLVEIHSDRAFFDECTKSFLQDSNFTCPCNIDPDCEELLYYYVNKAFLCLGLSGLVRFDVMIDDDNNIFFSRSEYYTWYDSP